MLIVLVYPFVSQWKVFLSDFMDLFRQFQEYYFDNDILMVGNLSQEKGEWLMNRLVSEANKVNRREFCKTTPCAAVGILTGTLVLGKTTAGKGGLTTEELSMEEEMMQGKVSSIQLKVISQEGHCGLGHKTGDVCTFTESGLEGKLCIHAMYSVLPKVFAMMHEAKFPWLQDPDIATHACPDASNPVVFEVKRFRESS